MTVEDLRPTVINDERLRNDDGDVSAWANTVEVHRRGGSSITPAIRTYERWLKYDEVASSTHDPLIALIRETYDITMQP